jgi:hypothetical protein
MRTLDGTFETQLAGTTTGVDHVDGTTTVAGTYTNELVGTEMIAELGTVAMTLVGTEFGTLFHETIATDGDEATTTTNEAESELTNEMGTTYGLDQVDGTVNVTVVTSNSNTGDGVQFGTVEI